MKKFHLNRRAFLKSLASIVGGTMLSPMDYAAASAELPVRNIRQLITADPLCSRTIMWDSDRLISSIVLELRSSKTTPIQTCHPVYNYYSGAASAFFTYRQTVTLNPKLNYEFRLHDFDTNRSTAWYQLGSMPMHTADKVSGILFTDSQCANDYNTWRDTFSAALSRHELIQFYAIIGDLVDNGESSWHWDSFWQAMDKQLLAENLLVPVLGNHEYYNISWTFAPPSQYLASFSLPDNGSKNFSGHYYSYDIGAAHFVVLDTQFLENAAGKELKREQLAWLQQDLQRSQSAWNIVLMHRDILAYDEYQPEQKTASGISDVGQLLLPVFDELPVDIVFSGHMHTYRRRRIARCKPSTARTAMSSANRDNIYYILFGPAGNQLYPVPDYPAYDEVGFNEPLPPNYIHFELDDKHFRFTCYKVSGEVIDALTLNKDNSA